MDWREFASEMELANYMERNYPAVSHGDVSHAKKAVASKVNVGNAHKILAQHHANIAFHTKDKDLAKSHARMALMHVRAHKYRTGQRAAIHYHAYQDMHHILGKELPGTHHEYHNLTPRGPIGHHLELKTVDHPPLPRLKEAAAMIIQVDGARIELAVGSYTREGNKITVPALNKTFEVAVASRNHHNEPRFNHIYDLDHPNKEVRDAANRVHKHAVEHVHPANIDFSRDPKKKSEAARIMSRHQRLMSDYRTSKRKYLKTLV